MSSNFVQLSGSGQGGRTLTLVPSTSVQTYTFIPSSLFGKIGNDFIYADRIRVRIKGFLNLIAGGTFVPIPNREQLVQALGAVRVYSQVLGEIFPKNITTAPILQNHDNWFTNGYKPRVVDQVRTSVSTTGGPQTVIIDLVIPFERKYLERSVDPTFWMPFLEQGIVEIDLSPSSALAALGWTMTGNWTATAVLDYHHDSQALIHVPAQPRLYRINSGGPEFQLLNVGSPQGLDGVVTGSRLAVLSWLGSGSGQQIGSNFFDNGFYAGTPTGSGLNFGLNGLSRLEVPWRDQRSVDDVTAWIASFLADTQRVRQLPQIDPAAPLNIQADCTEFPFNQDPSVAPVGDPLLGRNLNFWPLIWPAAMGEKIADMQQVDGTLSFTASFSGTPITGPVLNYFRSDEYCQFTQAKVRDLMMRMGLPHKADGGQYDVVPKYSGAKKSSLVTAGYLPLKIVQAQ